MIHPAPDLGPNLGPNPAPPKPRRTSLVARLCARLAGWRDDQSGVASLEFVLVVPIFVLIFAAAFESAMLLTRFVMLEQSVDRVMRELRLGRIPAPTSLLIRQLICEKSVILRDCMSSITLEMMPVDTATWAFPATPAGCYNREEDIMPSLDFNPGASQEVMFMRVCVLQDAMFPYAGIGMRLTEDLNGEYQIIATSAYVNEPS
jgi:hypothetical protein